MSAPLNKYLSLKCLRSYMKSEIYLLDIKIHEIIKKLRKNPKSSGTLTTLRKLREIISIVPELNMSNTTLLFNI